MEIINKDEKIVLLDVDDCIFPTSEILLKHVNIFLGTDYNTDNFKEYYVQQLLGDKTVEFFEYFKSISLYRDTKLIEGSYDVLEALSKDAGIKICPCSAFVWNGAMDLSGYQLKEKYETLLDRFPFINPHNHIYTSQKLLIPAWCRIDDRLDNLCVNTEINLLKDMYHNEYLSQEELTNKNAVRVRTWTEIGNRLL